MPTYLLQARRTPLGSLGGSLKSHTAPALAGAVLRALLAGVDPARVEECFLGQAVQAGCGPNPAGEAARLAGVPRGVSAVTVNQGRASGLQAVILAARSEAGLAIAGGMESASGAPYLLPSARWGTRMGSAPVLDALILDATWPEGLEARADRRRLLAAQDAGLFRPEIVPLETDRDDPQPGSGGILPADGAAAVLLGSERHAREHPPLARVLAWGQGPDEAQAVTAALAKAGLPLEAMDRLELDRPSAFPGLPPEAVNARGACSSLGLAPGAEGARKVVTLVHQLLHGNLRYGLAALESDGHGLALILERS